MRTIPQKNGSAKLVLEPDDVLTILDIASTKKTLAIRLMAESGLRVSEVAKLHMGDIYESSNSNVDLIKAHVRGKNPDDSEKTKKHREPWIPLELYEDLVEYCKRENIKADDPLFRVQKQQLRNWIKEVGDDAATATGHPGFESLTPHDLRIYFATNMVRRHGVDPEVVMDIGGWETREAMDDYLRVLFDSDIEDGLKRAGVHRSSEIHDPPKPHATTRLLEMVERLLTLVEGAAERLGVPVAESGESRDNGQAEVREDSTTIATSIRQFGGDNNNQNEDTNETDNRNLLMTGPVVTIGAVLGRRLRREQTIIESSTQMRSPLESVQQLAATIAVIVIGATFTALYHTWNGMLESLLAGESVTVASAVIAGLIMLPWMVYDIHESCHANPAAIEPETAFDHAIITTHAAVGALMRTYR